MIVVGTTCAPYKVDGSELNWLLHADEFVDRDPQTRFFAALELVPGRDPALYGRLRTRLATLAGTAWTFSLDDGERELTSGNRLTRICLGRNLIAEFAARTTASHVLFLDSDLQVPGDAIEKLLELNAPIAGGDVPSYCLHGPTVAGYDFPVERHWNTAGFLLVRRDVFTRVRWRHDPDHGLTDDPCYAADAVALGFDETLVRKDLIGHHVPLIPMEERGHDRRLA
jgi:hypothetical protein